MDSSELQTPCSKPGGVSSSSLLSVSCSAGWRIARVQASHGHTEDHVRHPPLLFRSTRRVRLGVCSSQSFHQQDGQKTNVLSVEGIHVGRNLLEYFPQGAAIFALARFNFVVVPACQGLCLAEKNLDFRGMSGPIFEVIVNERP